MLLFSFNLTRPQRMTERNNANYTASRSSTENSRYCGTRVVNPSANLKSTEGNRGNQEHDQ
jgi:hypothetical protein